MIAVFEQHVFAIESMIAYEVVLLRFDAIGGEGFVLFLGKVARDLVHDGGKLVHLRRRVDGFTGRSKASK